jgi:23S rRNA (uridine2479-2'-O)-methyltransferase
MKITTRNAAFQQWQALLTNRTKRHRAGEFLVHGVRPITLATEHGWPVRTLLYDMSRPLSAWARGIMDATSAPQVAMAPELLRELSEKDEDAPELIAVAAMPADDLTRIPRGLVVVADRMSSPGNIGTLVRSADAFGARGVIVTGHASDPYDPKAVRASTGSLFAIPVVRQPGPGPVLTWAGGFTVVGTDEKADADIADVDLTGLVLLAIGNETNGLSSGWRDACDVMARIPIAGAASSLNASAAATVILYEAARQRQRRR